LGFDEDTAVGKFSLCCVVVRKETRSWAGWASAGCSLCNRNRPEGKRRIGLIETIAPKMAKRFRDLFSFLWFESNSKYDSITNDFYSNLKLEHSINSKYHADNMI
jgi:hypothetical protein